jgi:NAD(P)-dependent dehydrogenase (short-subunit alcohol dehydrogenase family)
MEQPHEYTLVTGASSGIGEAVARRIAPAGRVILHGRDLERSQALRLGLTNPDAHLVWRQDLAGNAETAESLSGLLSGSAAVVTGFIHCAGEFRLLPVTAADPASVLRTFQVNYFSATAMIRVLLKKAVNRGALRAVVFVSSIASRFGARGYSTYAATKGALDSLSRSLAAELGPSVRVNSILPGGIQTRGTQFLYDAGGEAKLTEGYLLGPGSTDDIAGMAEYLISDRARWITGQQFVVDGGKTAH